MFLNLFLNFLTVFLEYTVTCSLRCTGCDKFLCHRNVWNVRYPDALIHMLDEWRPQMPEWMMANILEKFVFPKLQVEVENWNPLTDMMAIHIWIHPWLPMMGTVL